LKSCKVSSLGVTFNARLIGDELENILSKSEIKSCS
jgi:hypothetical protein